MASINRNDILNCINYCKENKLFDKLNDTYKSLPSGDCTGCGNCCMESVGINLIEFINIYNYLLDKDELRKTSLSKIIDYYFLEFTKKSACPFKDENNRCLIYEVRPLNCRIFGHWKKEDYNKNLSNITTRNREYSELMKSKYGFDISEEVVNYKIKYCEDFKPQNGYLNKSTRLSFADELMILDSKLYSKGIIDIDFKDRGIVEYFIEALLKDDTAYNIKIRLSKDEDVREIALKRLKKILL
ncbi:YkgJ family cysteine cluster protein [Romboutsia sp. 1001713B170131_170501_G6]|uniref:YkgJ family cysteine cluster protein n=1 Tax=Romboutsia sp. 1001713B170131_170501_G6 TaxID=2787108 RepID=UPI0018AB0BBC|nr:YkgJ family cysteine cluster protein [Romboutsia sp. 1001713B170131_170501_G6]